MFEANIFVSTLRNKMCPIKVIIEMKQFSFCDLHQNSMKHVDSFPKYWLIFRIKNATIRRKKKKKRKDENDEERLIGAQYFKLAENYRAIGHSPIFESDRWTPSHMGITMNRESTLSAHRVLSFSYSFFTERVGNAETMISRIVLLINTLRNIFCLFVRFI